MRKKIIAWLLAVAMITAGGVIAAQQVVDTDIVHYLEAPETCLSFDEDGAGGTADIFVDANCDNVKDAGEYYLFEFASDPSDCTAAGNEFKPAYAIDKDGTLSCIAPQATLGAAAGAVVYSNRSFDNFTTDSQVLMYGGGEVYLFDSEGDTSLFFHCDETPDDCYITMDATDAGTDFDLYITSDDGDVLIGGTEIVLNNANYYNIAQLATDGSGKLQAGTDDDQPDDDSEVPDNITIDTSSYVAVQDDTGGRIYMDYARSGIQRYDILADANSSYPVYHGAAGANYFYLSPATGATVFAKPFNATLGGTYASTVSFATGSILRVPNVNPTVNAVGAIGVDTTDVPSTGGNDQFVVYDGSNPITIPLTNPTCATLEDLAAADDDYAIWVPPFAVTITSAWCGYQGTGTTPATIDLQDAQGNAMTMTDATCGDLDAGVMTPQAVTANNTMTAYEGLAFNVTNAVNPETDKYTICWTYTVTRQ